MPLWLKLVLAALSLLVLLIGVRFVSMASSSRAAKPPGPVAGGLAPCPDRPNCVSSAAGSIAPIAWDGAGWAIAAARQTIEAMPRARVVRLDGDYLHAEFRSAVFGFVDDLELLWRDSEGSFEVRSASRVGHSDLGVNRRRVEELRRRLAVAADAP